MTYLTWKFLFQVFKKVLVSNVGFVFAQHIVRVFDVAFYVLKGYKKSY